MSILETILREIGLLGAGRTKKSKSTLLPDPEEIKEQVEKVIGDLSEVKDLPKAIMDRAVEAEEDFREADKAFRGTRLRKGKKK